MYSKFDLNVHEFVARWYLCWTCQLSDCGHIRALSPAWGREKVGERRQRGGERARQSKREIRETHKRETDRQMEMEAHRVPNASEWKEDPSVQPLSYSQTTSEWVFGLQTTPPVTSYTCASWGRITQLLRVWVLLNQTPGFRHIMCHMLMSHVTLGSLFTLSVSQCPQSTNGAHQQGYWNN